MWTIVTHSSTMPAIRYGGAKARAHTHARSAEHATASVVDAQ
jgi:hypothetical protein